MATAAVIVVAASLAAERIGAFVGAMIATLPVSAGPIYVFLAVDHGGEFVSRAAIASVVANTGTAAFVVIQAYASRRLGTIPTLALSLGGWLTVILLVRLRAWTLPEALIALLAGYGLAALLTRRFLAVSKLPAMPRTALDIPLRAGLVATVVAVATLAGEWFGPTVAGLFAVFPVVFTSLVLIMQPRYGGAAVAGLLARTFPGLVGFGVAITVLHFTAARMPVGLALLLALATAIAWNGGLVLLQRRRTA